MKTLGLKVRQVPVGGGAAGVGGGSRIHNLREVGVTLPEDTSREGCGVQVPELGEAAGRHPGRLEIDCCH